MCEPETWVVITSPALSQIGRFNVGKVIEIDFEAGHTLQLPPEFT
jgi:hypothetical protein